MVLPSCYIGQESPAARGAALPWDSNQESRAWCESWGCSVLGLPHGAAGLPAWGCLGARAAKRAEEEGRCSRLGSALGVRNGWINV